MKRAHTGAVCLAFAALAAWVTWPLARHLDDALPGDLGDPLLNTWILGWDADRLRHGLSGLWDAPIFYPYRQTLAFSEHLLGIGLPVAPLVWLTGSPIVGYNLAFLLSFVLAGGGMFVLARRVTGRTDAALIAATAFALAPSRFAHLGHLQMLMAGWMPLTLAALHRYVDTASRRSLAAFVAAFAAQGLSNNYFVYVLAVPVLVVVLHALACEPMKRRRLAVGLAAAAVVLFAAFAPIAKVYFDVRHNYGQHRIMADAAGFGADAGAYLSGNDVMQPPLQIWRALPHVNKPPGPEGNLFPGAFVLVFAAIALGARPPVPRRWVYGAVAIAGFALSLGAEPAAWGQLLPIGGVYRWLFQHVPGFDGLRVPARFSVVVLLAVAVLAALGFARATAALSARVRWGAAFVACVIVAFEGVGGAMPLALLQPHGRPDRAAYNWVRDAGDGAVLELPTGDMDRELRAYSYGYETLFHGHRIVNGASGYNAPLHAFIGNRASPLFAERSIGATIDMLRAIGVRTVVVHPDAFANPSLGASVVTWLRGSGGSRIASEAVFPGISVFRLAEAGHADRPPPSASDAAPRLRAIKASDFQASASAGDDRLPYAFDSDLSTRWFTGRPQSGTEWIDVAFSRPHDVARVELLMAGPSAFDYPRELAVDLIDRTGSPHAAFHAGVLTELARGLIDDPLRVPISLTFPPNDTARIRFRQLGTDERRYWSVTDIVLWERTGVPE